MKKIFWILIWWGERKRTHGLDEYQTVDTKKGQKEETKEDACQKFQSLGRPTAKQLNGNDMER